MNNYVILKWGSLKAYNFTDDFFKENEEIIKEFVNVWDRIYENHCSATGGSEEVKKSEQLRTDMLIVLEKLYDLGVIFENGWSDEYYNNFDEIKDYILNYPRD